MHFLKFLYKFQDPDEIVTDVRRGHHQLLVRAGPSERPDHSTFFGRTPPLVRRSAPVLGTGQDRGMPQQHGRVGGRMRLPFRRPEMLHVLRGQQRKGGCRTPGRQQGARSGRIQQRPGSYLQKQVRKF
ncbi:hypothetical protein TNIN_442061 [Trichonephila inaurata madagascariensis]|uniref:Uncharacterized protein n=1 Tax=Trichonephila inaurata madagascariensis TaxID=2747483 RepID=A0A8X7C380_9ARAC|nr:hypothetical protein TNIN_442061 [Trichonephila inaurata madagascariensis]